MRHVQILPVVLAALAVLDCGAENAVRDTQSATAPSFRNASSVHDFVISVDRDGANGFRATLPDGTVYTDPELYAEQVPGALADALANNQRVLFAAGPTIAADLDRVFDTAPETSSPTQSDSISTRDGPEFGQVAQPLGFALPGGYYFSMSVATTRWVGGCVSRDCTPGFAIRLHRNGTQLWDMHGGTYVSGGRVCIGLYESQSRWCRNWCSPTYSQVRNAIYSAAIAAGIGAATAWVIAQAVTPVVMTALAL